MLRSGTRPTKTALGLQGKKCVISRKLTTNNARQRSLPVGPEEIEVVAFRQPVYAEDFYPAVARPADIPTSPSTFATTISTPRQSDIFWHMIPTPAPRHQHEIYRRKEDAGAIPSTEKSHELGNPPSSTTPPPPPATVNLPQPMPCPMWGRCPSGYRIWALEDYCYCFPDVSGTLAVTTVT
jgi:hypothetical protein